MKLLSFLSPLVLQQMKEDYFSQLDHYGEPFCEQQYTNRSCLFVCSNSDPLISLIPPPPPRTASYFRHLLSCDTIVKFTAFKDVRVHAPITWIKLGIPIYFIDHSEFITVQCEKILSRANNNEIKCSEFGSIKRTLRPHLRTIIAG